MTVVLDCKDLWSVTKIGGDAGGEIAGKTATGETIELGGDLGFETEAGGGEKGPAVGQPCVDETRLARVQNGERPRNRAVNTEMAAQAVAGAARDEAERGGRAGDDGGDLVQRAVTADGDEQLATGAEGGDGEFGRMAGTFGEKHLGAVVGREGSHGVDGVEGATGAGVDDEDSFQTGKIFDRR